MEDIAKVLVSIGVLLIVVGILWSVGSKYLGLGKLPGDIVIERENVRFFFPLATSIIISVLLSLILWLFFALKK